MRLPPVGVPSSPQPPKPTMQPFAELGALVEARWRNENYNEEAFPEIAAQALSEMKQRAPVDPWEIIRWVHESPDLPEQMDPTGRFGNPPITVYVGPRFYVDVYFWLDGTTTIHQHAFSGAFQVLLGSSVHAGYRFQKTREINPHFLTGKLALDKVSLLTQGEIREIHPGADFIHSLFHLDRPSVTITIRTYKAPAAAVQYSYLKPYLAINPFFDDSSLTKKTQTVSLLLRMKHPEADNFIGNLLETSDFHTAFLVLNEAFNFLCHRELEEIIGVSRSHDRFQALLDRARGKHGEFADLLLPVFEEGWRQSEITRRRTEIKGQDHRFFLALLLNVPERTTLLRLVKEKFPDDDPLDLVVRWVRELSATKIFGSREPNVLGIGEFDDRHLLVLRGLFEGLREDEMRARAAAEPQRWTFGESSIEAVTNQLRTLPLFQSIFCAE
jgi:hypothetical protein